MRKSILVFACLVSVLSGLQTASGAAIKIGILPVLDTLPLQVAVHDGLFQARGLDVQLVPFNSAMERDVAMQSGHLDGYFGDIINTLLLIQNQVPMRIVTVSYSSRPGQRMFALVTAPSVHIADATVISGLKVGISSATIIEYLLDRMQACGKIPADGLIRTEVKKIPIRLQMLLAGQLDLAVLPEPLVTLAEQSGSTALLTDEFLNMPLTVLCLHEKVMQSNPEAASAFLEAYGNAIAAIRKNPEAYRGLMAETCRIPKPLLQVYPIPRYPDPQLPQPSAVADAQNWMKQHHMLKDSIPYEELVVKGRGRQVRREPSPDKVCGSEVKGFLMTRSRLRTIPDPRVPWLCGECFSGTD